MNNLEFERSTHIKLDLFPATVTKDGEIVAQECRVIVTNDYFYVILNAVEGPYFVVKEELVEFEIVPKVGYNVYGAHFEYSVTRDGNCGCGSRLRGMRFLPGVPHISRIALKTK